MESVWLNRVRSEMRRLSIAPGESAPASGPCSLAVSAGDLIFVTGLAHAVSEPGIFAEAGVSVQTRQILEKLTTVLSAQGCTLTDVVKTTVFLKNRSEYTEMNEVYRDFFGTDCPPLSCVEVMHLPRGVLLEIEAVARRAGA